MVQSPGLGSPTPGVQVQLLTVGSTKTSQVIQHRKQNPKSNGKSNTQQPRAPKETHILTKEKGKTERIKIGVKREQANQ